MDNEQLGHAQGRNMECERANRKIGAWKSVGHCQIFLSPRQATTVIQKMEMLEDVRDGDKTSKDLDLLSLRSWSENVFVNNGSRAFTSSVKEHS
jgi:hypothetical protein